ncbi:hypothetical protein [Amycolatopsis thermophila]|uniref:Uncharacterized protein n=1 Tax=Amycolatopsis thermophila TaxID=206084 RepID=A0ABU0F535_9PSEU|nr:hypothetical protein [Amycolatopsis thermophila]MDQ0382647.1 hypothetical protein [Amycolatopsis thermophila]
MNTAAVKKARAELGDDHEFLCRALEGRYGEPASHHADSLVLEPDELAQLTEPQVADRPIAHLEADDE